MKKFLSNKLPKQDNREKEITIRSTPVSAVNFFIDKLHPYETDRNLVRLGPDYDGGYLVPNDMTGIEACFSPGVGEMSEFEQDCSKRGMKLFLADKSIEKPNLNLSSKEYHFIQKFIGCTNNTHMTTLDDWVESSNVTQNSDLLLQMDIEGGEFNSLIRVSDELIKRFRIMVIEFHFLEKLWNPIFYAMASSVFNKILQSHICVHIHPNNYSEIETQFNVKIPKVAEFTFLRKDRVEYKRHSNHFPHEYDFDNSTKKKHIKLPPNWYRS